VVDTTYHLNVLNRNLQREGNTGILQLEVQIHVKKSTLCLREREGGGERAANVSVCSVFEAISTFE
jgi:hypothetical protein